MKLDGLLCLSHFLFLASAVSLAANSHYLPVILIAALASHLLLLWRDEILRPRNKKDPLDEIKSKLSEIESELSSIKFSNGIRRLE